MAAIMVKGYRRGRAELKPASSKASLCKFFPEKQSSPGIQQGPSTMPDMTRITRLKRRNQIFIAALMAVALTSSAIARDAVVGREPNAKIRTRVVELVNEAREHGRRCGSERYAAAPPLSISGKLGDAATDHARDMARKKFFEHRGSDGSQPKERVLRAGYQSRLTGENIAYGPESAEEVVAGWLASRGHCENIMDSRFEDIGVAFAIGRKRGQIYWVQTFGSPRSGHQQR
jgi:uncharacterized protein YkwD